MCTWVCVREQDHYESNIRCHRTSCSAGRFCHRVIAGVTRKKLINDRRRGKTENAQSTYPTAADRGKFA